MPKIQSKIGIIGGGNLFGIDIFKKTKERKILTPYGKVFFWQIDDIPVICRHGPKKDIPPHKINHKANISAFKKLGVKYVFAFNSVGSLRKAIKPGTFLIPDDFIGFETITFFDKKMKFITPCLSKKLRKILVKIFKKIKFPFRERGIYFETRGPRLETKAEINLIKRFADVVGMTMAKEATLAKELDLEYASLCSIDNYGHGISKKELTEKEIRESQLKMGKKIEKIIGEILNL